MEEELKNSIQIFYIENIETIMKEEKYLKFEEIEKEENINFIKEEVKK
jgi:hypothetical protein